jgi:hypothetical protein
MFLRIFHCQDYLLIKSVVKGQVGEYADATVGKKPPAAKRCLPLVYLNEHANLVNTRHVFRSSHNLYVLNQKNR